MHRHLTLIFLLTTCLSHAQYIDIWTAEEQDFSNYSKTTPSFIPEVFLDARGEYTRYVDPHIGTSGHGHTFPGATLPFGMVQISPDNGVYGWDWCSGYHYSRPDIVYFSHKHLSGTGATDLGDIGMIPYTGKYAFRHTYEHANEYARPGYYAVKLDNGILCEFTVTAHGAIHRYTFPEGTKDKKLRIDLLHDVTNHKDEETFFSFIDDHTLGGYKHSNGWAPNQHVYFHMTSSHGMNISKKDRKQAKKSVDIEFKGGGNVVELRVALGSTSVDAAAKNGKYDNLKKAFEQHFETANILWEKRLGRIQAEFPSKEQKITFYTALYHSMIAPALNSDVDGAYTEPDGSITQMPEGLQRYSTFSLWDTYRAAHSLFFFTAPDVIDDFIASMLAHYNFRGQLPIWELESNETFCMIGNHAVPVLAEAFMKRMTSYELDNVNWDDVLEACDVSSKKDFRGMASYMTRGYVSTEADGESVSKTLEYCYDDHALSLLAKGLGRDDLYDEYLDRSMNYKNLFDPSTGLMRPKNDEGEFLKDFDPFAHDINGVRHYTEGNAWQYNWHVMHDPEGLVGLYENQEAFEIKLDSLFAIDIHIDEAHKLVDVTGLIGQYAHGNEPSHHITYLYNYTENPWKGQQRIRETCNTYYSHTPDGLSGNEDCGQMSAWYVFSTMGLYPMDPASAYYEIGSPLVENASIALPNGNTFSIVAKGQSEENYLVKEVLLNGKPLEGHRISHQQILDGGTLEFIMTN